MDGIVADGWTTSMCTSDWDGCEFEACDEGFAVQQMLREDVRSDTIKLPVSG
jgi:hypothetical protein